MNHLFGFGFGFGLGYGFGFGFGFVATESTDRAGKQWNNKSLSLSANADLARLSRLYTSLVSASQITAQTPIYAIGMSQGAGFTSVFAQAFANAGYPVAAIAPSHGPIPAVVRNQGGLTVPALFALGANDPIVDDAQVERQVFQVAAAGVAVELHVEPETNLTPARFLRVPAIESGLNHLPALAAISIAQQQMLRDEIDVVLAVHQYSATYASQTVAFFDARC